MQAADARPNSTSVHAVGERLRENVESVVYGKPREVGLVVAALACRGHVLIEDVLGTAKTVLARALAQSIDGASAGRIARTAAREFGFTVRTVEQRGPAGQVGLVLRQEPGALTQARELSQITLYVGG